MTLFFLAEANNTIIYYYLISKLSCNLSATKYLLFPGLPLPVVGARGGLLHGGQLHDLYPGIRGLALVDHARHLERGEQGHKICFTSPWLQTFVWTFVWSSNYNTTYCVLTYFLCLQKMDTIVSPTLDLAEIRPKDSDAAAHSKLTHI